MSHPIVHVEFSSRDRAESANFYSVVFGWKTVDLPEMNYTIYEAEGGPGGGFNLVTDQKPAGTVAVYISTDDIDTTLADVEANGGKTLIPKSEIPQTGWFAFFSDPTGNVVGLYTAMQQ